MMRSKLLGLMMGTVCLSAMSVWADCADDHCDKGSSCIQSCCEQDEGLFVLKDLLIWKQTRSGMDDSLGFTDDGAGLENGRMHVMESSWQLGFRAGIGFRLPCNRWDVRLLYTRFHTSAKTALEETVVPAYLSMTYTQSRLDPLVTDRFFSQLSAKENTHYDVVDFLLGHPFCPCPSFETRLYGGPRLLFLKQDMRVKYFGLNFEDPNDGLTWDAKYYAYGLHGGFEWWYHLCGAFSLYGDASASVVVGKNENKQGQVAHNETVHWVNVTESEVWQTALGSHLALGLNWEGCCGDIVVNVTCGYELQAWSNVPDQRRFFDATARGVSTPDSGATLGFHGLFLSSRADF